MVALAKDPKGKQIHIGQNGLLASQPQPSWMLIEQKARLLEMS